MLDNFWLSLEYLPIAGEIGATAWFPFIESVHVLSITFLLGAILMVDLRVLGLAARVYPLARVVGELVSWSAWALLVANITGIGMFITRASVHVENPAFQLKMFLLILAGMNIAYFHFRAMPAILKTQDGACVPLSGRVAAGASLFLWCAVMLAGRWVGHVI